MTVPTEALNDELPIASLSCAPPDTHLLLDKLDKVLAAFEQEQNAIFPRRASSSAVLASKSKWD